MQVAVKTLMAISGRDGRHQKDVVIHVAADRADFLVKNGYAARADVQAQKAAPRPVRKAASKATPAKTGAKAK